MDGVLATISFHFPSKTPSAAHSGVNVAKNRGFFFHLWVFEPHLLLEKCYQLYLMFVDLAQWLRSVYSFQWMELFVRTLVWTRAAAQRQVVCVRSKSAAVSHLTTSRVLKRELSCSFLPFACLPIQLKPLKKNNRMFVNDFHVELMPAIYRFQFSSSSSRTLSSSILLAFAIAFRDDVRQANGKKFIISVF